VQDLEDLKENKEYVKIVEKEIKRINSMRMSKNDFVPHLSDYFRTKYSGEFIMKNNFDRYNLLRKNYKQLVKLIDKEDKN